MSERTGFIMHFENCKYFSRLNDEQLGVLFRAVCAYAADGTEPDFDSDVLAILFDMIRGRMDRDAEKYDERCKRNAQNARKGGRPRKTGQGSDKAKKTDRFSEKPEKPNCDPDPVCDPDPDPECDPVCDRVCDPDAACAAPAAPELPHTPHTPHTAEELTVDWVLRTAREQGYVWTQEEAANFIAYNRDRGRSDGWVYAMAQWEKNRPRMERQNVNQAPASAQSPGNMNKYLQCVNRFKEDEDT